MAKSKTWNGDRVRSPLRTGTQTGTRPSTPLPALTRQALKPVTIGRPATPMPGSGHSFTDPIAWSAEVTTPVSVIGIRRWCKDLFTKLYELTPNQYRLVELAELNFDPGTRYVADFRRRVISVWYRGGKKKVFFRRMMKVYQSKEIESAFMLHDADQLKDVLNRMYKPTTEELQKLIDTLSTFPNAAVFTCKDDDRLWFASDEMFHLGINDEILHLLRPDWYKCTHCNHQEPDEKLIITHEESAHAEQVFC